MTNEVIVLVGGPEDMPSVIGQNLLATSGMLRPLAVPGAATYYVGPHAYDRSNKVDNLGRRVYLYRPGT
jgi:hypothetical protein